MSNRHVKDLERLQHRLERAVSPEEERAARDELQQYLEEYIAESAQLAANHEARDLGKKQGEMRARLEAWGNEARAILESEISDPEALRAALDNSRYKEQVAALAGTPFSRLGNDYKHPALTRPEQAIHRVEAQKKAVAARIERASVLFRWIILVGFIAVAVWVFLGQQVTP